MLKRRHLELLGHALVSVPYWERDRCKGAVAREQSLKRKLPERILSHSLSHSLCLPVWEDFIDNQHTST